MKGLWSSGTLFSRYKTCSVTTDLWVTTVTRERPKAVGNPCGTHLLRSGCPMDRGKVSRKQKGKQQDHGHLG